MSSDAQLPTHNTQPSKLGQTDLVSPLPMKSSAHERMNEMNEWMNEWMNESALILSASEHRLRAGLV